MTDGHKSRRFKDLKIGDLFTFNSILFTKLALVLPVPGIPSTKKYNAISDTTTGSRKTYFASNTIVEKLDE